MVKKFVLSLLITIASLGIISCNSESYDGLAVTYSNVAVTAFSLNEDDDVLANLDSVYFSIDIERGRIYNADSLPYGTDISRLLVNITTSSCSKVDLIVPRENQSDTTINYLTNSTDSIDFSNGMVTLHLVSGDLTNERYYGISVNVHQVKPDSLYWNRLERSNLPSINIPNDQKTVEYKNGVLCLTRVSEEYCIATIDNPANENWDRKNVEFGFIPDVSSFTASDNALYILDTNGNLYTSIDAATWTSCEEQWYSIYGGYQSLILGVKKQEGKYYHVTYPATSSVEVDADCPISGTSQLLVFDNKWDVKPFALMVGGQCTDGRLTGATWGYDGTVWTKISQSTLPALEGVTLFPYFTYKTNKNNWEVTQYSTLVAMCGRGEDGKATKDVYISLDQGMHWKLADDLMQLPEYIPACSNAQALVFKSTIQSRSSDNNAWDSYSAKILPSWWSIEPQSLSRVMAPVTEWECPYVYLFGGEDARGRLYNTIWRGVINRLYFKPIY